MNIIIIGERKLEDIVKYPPHSWRNFFYEVAKEIYIIEDYLKNEKFYPSIDDVFRIFFLVPFSSIKVVILGQDPYDTKGYADGLSFSCRSDIPKSLDNIFKVLEKTVKDFKIPNNGDLTKWALQGVFLINTALTVKPGKPEEHIKIWRDFTEALMNHLSLMSEVVYMLWGAKAQKYEKHIKKEKNLILKTSHPSPRSAYLGFMDCDHFNQANEYLIKNDMEPIDWRL